MADGPLRSLLVDGVIAGVGSVLVFLPQILILFFFILVLEDCGYLPRAAFLLDRLMGRVGLSGRAFIPLLSSFACAIPGIMATRTIPNAARPAGDHHDRAADDLFGAPAGVRADHRRLHPARSVGPFNLQGLVLFALYVAGVVGAVLVALVMKRATMRSSYHPLLMELPEYHWPNLRNLLTGLWERTQIFLTRVGTIILALMVLMWFLASYPAPPDGATGPAIRYSFAGMLGRGLEYIFAPIGFNWQIIDRAGAGPGRARGRGRRARHRLRAVQCRRHGRRERAAADDRAQLEPRHGAVAAGLVCVCAAMPVDAGHRASRNQFLALPADHGRLPVRAGLRRIVHRVSRDAAPDGALRAGPCNKSSSLLWCC